MSNTTAQLERLIADYETAIFSKPTDNDLIDKLSAQVEAEADRIGYDNHRRLYALHTAAEAASMGA